MSSYTIPLAGVPETFSIALNGTTYQLTLQWRANPLGGWILDIADATGVMIIAGISLVAGVNLLGQYSYLGIAGGSALVLVNVAGGDAAPTFENLGTDVVLKLVTP